MIKASIKAATMNAGSANKQYIKINFFKLSKNILSIDFFWIVYHEYFYLHNKCHMQQLKNQKPL